MVSWLAGVSANYVTGATVRVDGGLNLGMARAWTPDGPVYP